MESDATTQIKLNSDAQIMLNLDKIQSMLKLKMQLVKIHEVLVLEKRYSYSYVSFSQGLKKILKEKEKTKELVQTQTIPTSKLSTKSKDIPVKANSNKTKGFYAETNPDVNQLV